MGVPGRVAIGDDVIDVPAGAVVGGVPAPLIRMRSMV